MKQDRMEAFSDGVLAIIMTIMILKVQTPQGVTMMAIRNILPTLVAYILSYLYIGIYWVNHHYLLTKIDQVSTHLLWENLMWLFWMSLIPLATDWVGSYPFTLFPTLFYGFILLMTSFSYYQLELAILKDKKNKSLQKNDKTMFSILLYGLGMGAAFLHPLLSYILYALIAGIWFIPKTNINYLIEIFSTHFKRKH